MIRMADLMSDPDIYGLKQSPRVWYQHLTAFFSTIGFKPLPSDNSVFHNGQIIIGIYVDDMLICGANRQSIDDVKSHLHQRFQMSDLGPINFYLGMKITRNRELQTIWLSQSTYIEQILKDHGFAEYHPVSTPMVPGTTLMSAPADWDCPLPIKRKYQSAVGSLMYAMLGTRPDIAFAVSVISRYSSNPTVHHWTAVTRVFKYLKGTLYHQLVYRGDLKPLRGYTDTDWAGNHETRRSTAGYVFDIGSGAISWSSKRQATVAASTSEAEYGGQTSATKEAVWLGNILSQLSIDNRHGNPNAQPRTVVLYSDNQGAIALAKNPQFHGRTKHIDIAVKFVREKVADDTIDLRYIPTADMVADGLTKALDKSKFEAFRLAVGVEDPSLTQALSDSGG